MFAIVTFTEENSTGIVSTNWISADNSICLYPNTVRETEKNKVLKNREVPKDDWLSCGIKVLKEYSTYDAARTRLSEAEFTSNLDSEGEENERKRKRKKRVIRLPGEESDESDDELDESNKRCLIEDLPSPPTRKSLFTTPNTTGVKKIQSPSPMNQSKQSTTLTFPQRDHTSWTRLSTPEPARSGAIELRELSQIKANQNLMWKTLEEYRQDSERRAITINAKLDKLLELMADQGSGQRISSERPVDETFYTKLPLGLNDFEEFEGKLQDSSFKQKMMRLLYAVGGRDARAMVANSLRKIITEEVAETFSLTGKSIRDGPKKKPFVKTATYQLICEVTLRKYKEANEKVIREAVCDWLMQSKFRRVRKEMRMQAHQH